MVNLLVVPFGRPFPRAKAVMAFGLLSLLAAVVPSSSWGGQFSVTPVRIFMQPKDRAVAVTVTNEGDEELVMQADLYEWKQKPGGEDDLKLTEDMFLSPPIIKLAPRARQVVRLARSSPLPPGNQLTYRMIVREVPEAKPADKTVQVQIALAFSLPVFITPPGVKPQLECSTERTAPDTVRVGCQNRGNAYAQPREFVLTNEAGDRLASRDTGGYILPEIKRSFDIKRAEGPIAGGKAKLLVTLDDGSTQTFDVTLAE